MANKTNLLVSALFKSTPKVFFDRPDVLSDAEIAEELAIREQTDQMLSRARIKLINQMFQKQTSIKPIDNTPQYDF